MVGQLIQYVRDLYALHTNVPGGVGRVEKGVEKEFLVSYSEIGTCLDRLSDLLSRHRSVEDVIGTERAVYTRANMLAEADRIMRYLEPVFKRFLGYLSYVDSEDLQEVRGAFGSLREFLPRARRSEHEGHRHRRSQPLPDTTGDQNYWTIIGWKQPPLKA